MISAYPITSAKPYNIQGWKNGRARTKQHTVGAGNSYRGFQPDGGVDDGVEENILRKHIPDAAARRGGGSGSKVQVVGDAALEAAGEEGESASGVSEEDGERGVAVKDAR